MTSESLDRLERAMRRAMADFQEVEFGEAARIVPITKSSLSKTERTLVVKGKTPDKSFTVSLKASG